MKKIRRIFKASKRWRQSPLGTRTRSSAENPEKEYGEAVMFMDEHTIDETMERIRELIHRHGPLEAGEVEEIKEAVTLFTESGNERSVYTHGKEEQDTSLLCEAVLHNKMDVLVMLVEHGMNVNASFGDKSTVDQDLPLHVACAYGKLESVSYLLSQGADPTRECVLRELQRDRATEEPQDAFTYALETDNVRVLNILLQQPSIRVILPKFLLHKACELGARDCVKRLLDFQPELIIEKDDRGITPLGHAFWVDPGIASNLAESDPNAITRELISGEMGHTSSSELFIKLCSLPPSDLNVVEALNFLFKYAGYETAIVMDETKETGLHYLCKTMAQIVEPFNSEHYENILSAIQLLLAVGADTEKRNTSGKTPLMTLLTSVNFEQLREVNEHTIQINFSFITRTLTLLLNCGASARSYSFLGPQEEIISMNPLQSLVTISNELDDSMLLLVHTSIRNMVEDIMKHRNTEDNAQSSPMLVCFMKAYLTRLPKDFNGDIDKLNYEIVGDRFTEINKIFLSHNVNIYKNLMENKRPTNIYKQFIYALMQDIEVISRARVGVVKSFASMLYVLLRLRKKVDISGLRPDLSGFHIHYQGPDDLPSYFSYIIIGDVHLQSTTGIINLVLETYHVLHIEDQRRLKHSMIARLKDASVSKTVLELVQSHLECLPG